MNASTNRKSIDLLADLGEGCPWDQILLKRVSSAAVGCGFHAGDEEAIGKTLEIARERKVAVGAHPGFADRESFGRSERPISREETRSLIVVQVESLRVIADPVGVTLRFLKPHGALYNQAQRSREIALGVVEGAKDLGLSVLGLPGSEVERGCEELSVRFLSEGFADRRYDEEGRLVPRSRADSILTDPGEIEAQIARLVDRGIDILCLHGDDERSVALSAFLIEIIAQLGLTKRAATWP